MTRPSTRPRLPLVLGAVLALVLPLTALASSTSTASGAAAAPGTTTTFTANAWPAREVKAGSSPKVTGAIEGWKAGRRVYLEQLVRGYGWLAVGGTNTDAAGRFSLTLPTSWLHEQLPFRVRVPGTNRATQAISAASFHAVAPNRKVRGKRSWWRRIEPGVRYRYDACQVITWRANLSAAKPGAVRDAKEAVRRLGVATGITFQYRGTTSHRTGNLRTWPKDTNLIIAWLTPKQSPIKFGPVAGWGGPRQGTWMRDYEGRTAKITQSRVLLNGNLKLPRGFKASRDGGGPKVGFASRGTLLMHELGHAAGLGHVLKRPGQMMSYKSTTKYEAGDLGGLHEVGKAQGCMLPLQGASRLAPPPVPEPEDHAHH